MEIELAMLEIAVTDSIVTVLFAGVEESSFVVVATEEEAKVESSVEIELAVLDIGVTDPSVIVLIAGVEELSEGVVDRTSMDIVLLVARLDVTGSFVVVEMLILDTTTEETSVVMTVEIEESSGNIVEDSESVLEGVVVGISELAASLLATIFTVLAWSVEDADAAELDELFGGIMMTALSIRLDATESPLPARESG